MPTILVQNKMDVSDEGTDADVRVSAMDGDGMEDLKLLLEEMISNDPEFKKFKALDV